MKVGIGALVAAAAVLVQVQARGGPARRLGAADALPVAPERRELATTQVEMGIFNELEMFYHLHLDYYSMYQNLVVGLGCSSEGVAKWWSRGPPGQTGEATMDRFVERLVDISDAEDVSDDHRAYARSLGAFFVGLRETINGCARKLL